MLSSSLKHFQSFYYSKPKNWSLSVLSDPCKLPLKATEETWDVNAGLAANEISMDAAIVVVEQLW